MGTSKEPPRQPTYEPSGAKDPPREQGVVHSQPRVFQNDPKDSKSELQGTSNSITPNPLFIQESKNPTTVLRSAAEAKPVNIHILTKKALK